MSLARKMEATGCSGVNAILIMAPTNVENRCFISIDFVALSAHERTSHIYIYKAAILRQKKTNNMTKRDKKTRKYQQTREKKRSEKRRERPV